MERNVVLADGLRVDKDGIVRKDGRPAIETDIPIRKSGPYKGQRALRVVPAGYRDCTINDKGELVAIEPTKVAEPIAIERDR